MKKLKLDLGKIWLLISLWAIHGFAFAVEDDNTFGNVADTFQQWTGGSYGKLVLMVALAMIMGSFMFGGGAKIIWGGIGLGLIVKYGATILTTIAGLTAEVTQAPNAWATTDSLGWDFIFSTVLVICLGVSIYRYKKVKKELDEERAKNNSKLVKSDIETDTSK